MRRVSRHHTALEAEVADLKKRLRDATSTPIHFGADDNVREQWLAVKAVCDEAYTLLNIILKDLNKC